MKRIFKLSIMSFVALFALFTLVGCAGINADFAAEINEKAKVDEHYTYGDLIDKLGDPTVDISSNLGGLIGVSGIGPKTAITMLSVTTPQSFIQAIELGNTGYLKKLPGIGSKSASQIILDLKGKLVVDVNDTLEVKQVNKDLEDTREALKGLGFKASDIDSVLKVVGQEKLTSQQYLKKALQLLRK